MAFIGYLRFSYLNKTVLNMNSALDKVISSTMIYAGFLWFMYDISSKATRSQ